MLVVDTNTIAYLLIEGTETENCKKILRCDPDWHSPYLWRSEFGNVLLQHSRRGHLAANELAQYMSKTLDLMRGGEESVSPVEVLRLSAESGRSFYDCEFVSLARSLQCPLITSDKQILKTFPKVAMPPGEF